MNLSVLEVSKSGWLALVNNGTDTTEGGVTELVYTTDGGVPGSATSGTGGTAFPGVAGTQTDKVTAYGTRTFRYFPGITTSNSDVTRTTKLSSTTTVFGNAAACSGIDKADGWRRLLPGCYRGLEGYYNSWLCVYWLTIA